MALLFLTVEVRGHGSEDRAPELARLQQLQRAEVSEYSTKNRRTYGVQRRRGK
ncbi:hypothetical protein [Streptomyces bacillaris]|uniref:hypothetical protein n=1 Tax=Streptomyces bacillaris TaxID=68179 RepID=UPI000A4982EF